MFHILIFNIKNHPNLSEKCQLMGECFLLLTFLITSFFETLCWWCPIFEGACESHNDRQIKKVPICILLIIWCWFKSAKLHEGYNSSTLRYQINKSTQLAFFEFFPRPTRLFGPTCSHFPPYSISKFSTLLVYLVHWSYSLMKFT